MGVEREIKNKRENQSEKLGEGGTETETEIRGKRDREGEGETDGERQRRKIVQETRMHTRARCDTTLRAVPTAHLLDGNVLGITKLLPTGHYPSVRDSLPGSPPLARLRVGPGLRSAVDAGPARSFGRLPHPADLRGLAPQRRIL